MLRIRGLSGGYPGNADIVRGATLTVGAGEMAIIEGANGSGKSTLLRMLAGLLPWTSGTLEWEGRQLAPPPPDGAAFPWAGLMLQDAHVFSSLTVLNNLRLAGTHLRAADGVVARFSALEPLMNVRAGLLSGGQRKLLGTAMLFVRRASLLLLDEPLAGLTVDNAGAVRDAVRDACVQGATAIIVEHATVEGQARWQGRRVLMTEGRLTGELGTPASTPPEAAAAPGLHDSGGLK